MKETVNGMLGRDNGKTPAKQGKSRQRRAGPFVNLGEGASPTARRVAAAVLEVLAGARTPTQAAEALGVALPRYYLLEVRALHGMLLACEPRAMGRQATTESALAALRRECEQLRRDCIRQQALARAAQRTLGLAPPTAASARPSKNGSKRRRRRPTARGLRAAARLQAGEPIGPPAPMGIDGIG